MKLRLPYKLQAALLAAFTAVAFTAQQTQAGSIDQHNTLNLDDNTTYNGYIYNFVPANADATTQFHSGALYRYEQNGDHMEQTATSTIWQSFANNQAPTYGHTLRLTDNVNGKTVNTGFSPLSLGGLIVEDGTYTLGRANTATDFNGFGNVNLNIMGDFTLLSRGVDKTVNSGVRFDKGGEWRIAEGKTLKFDTATYAVTIRPNLTVNVTGGGTLDLASAAKFVLGAGTHFNVASGTTVTMSNVLETQGTAYYSGNLTLPATLNISGGIGGYEVYEAAASDFNGTDDYAGSGYRTGNATKYYIVKGGEGSTLSGLPTTVTGGDNATIVDGKSLVATISLAGEDTTYYTNSSFTYNEEVMGGASGFSIAKGTVLSAGSTTSFSSAKVLHGTGTYALADTAATLTGSLTLGDDWTGTVRLTNASATSLNFGNLVNGAQSTIEFNGFTGYSNAWNGTNVQNIKLTAPDGGGVAWNATGAVTSKDNNTATYSGTWSGDGTMTIAPNKLNYTFTGDISQWTGKLQTVSAYANTFNLTFTGNAHAINAEIAGQHNTNKMNLVVDTNATFSKNVTANTLSVSNGRTATLGATATFDGLTGEGDIASTGSITLSGASGSYEFDGAITGAHLLNKTGAGTQTINGPVTVDRFTIGGGTTTFNGLVTGTGAGYSGNDRRMSVSGGTVYFNNGFAYSGEDGYALVTSANTTVHFGGASDLTGKSIGPVATAKIVLDAGASLKVTDLMNSTANKGSGNGTLEMESGSELTVAGKMYLTDASSNGGTIHLGNGSTVNLYAGAYTPNIMEFGLGAVVLDGAATTIQTAHWGGTVVLDSIAGTGTLTLKANADSTVRNTFSIGDDATESKFTGTIALERATGSNRVLLAEFNDMYSAAGAVVQASLSGNHNSEAVGILINSDVVQMKGLNDGSGITSANSYALASGSASRLAATNGNSNQYLDNASDGTFRTLEFTGSTATESYSTAIKVLGGVNLKMSGEGTQTFSGDMSQFNGSLTVNNGTLAITGNNGISAAYIASDTSDGTLDVTGVLTVTGAEAGMADFTGSLKVGGLHVDGGFNQINGIDRLGESIQVNNGGCLVLGIGTYELSGLTLTGPGEVTPTEGNGYTSFSGTVQFITPNGGEYLGSDDLTFKYGKYTTHTLDDHSGVVTFDEHDYTTYYVNGDATYSDAEMGKAQYLQIKEGQVLTAGGTPSTAKTLVGSGTYALASNAKTLGDKVSLDADNWTGTVAISNVAFANDMKGTLEGLANENSWVALKGTSGWAASCTINANLLLEKGNSDWAFAQNDGLNDNTLTFAGKIAGDGKLGRSSETGSTYTYEFTNDISKWNGTFESRSYGDRYTMFRVKDAATEVNASLTKASGVFKVDVQNKATFNGDVSDVDALTVADNQSATFTNVLEVRGTINLGTDATLTLSGDTAIAQAIAGTATSTVVFNHDITASGLAGGQRDYFTGLDGQKATNENYFIGKEAYLTVVTGGGTVNTGGHKVTQGGKDYLLDADGTAAGEKDIDYTSFCQFQAGTTLNASTIDQTAQAHGQTLTTVSTAAAKLILDRNIDNVYLFDGAELDITNDSLIKKELAAAGNASISGNLTLTQNATFSLAKWEPSSVTFTDSPFEVSGVTFTASAGTGRAVVSYTGTGDGEADMNNYEVYGIANANFKVAADVVQKNIAGGDVTVGNKIEASEVRNDAPGTYGALILTSGADATVLDKVIATRGNIEFYNMSDTDQANLNTLNIGEGMAVSVYTGNVAEAAKEASVTVMGTLTAGEGARLNADLEMASGSTLDVSAFNGNGGLFMGSSVTLNPGNITLSDDDIAHVQGLGFMEAYDLFRDVEDFNIGSTGYESIGLTDQWVKASEVFNNELFKTGEKEYYVFYSGTAEGGHGENVGTIYLLQAPEPTTGTLSLLALCALAARRRRK